MRASRWIDHAPPWLAYGAVSGTGVYEPGELALMAAPLLLAALVEWRDWGLASWRRVFEAAALACLGCLIWARIGLVPSVVVLLFLLCGIRLALPREPEHARQLLLMSFLAWLTTAITTFELTFLLWSVLWVAGAAMVLLHHAWEASACLRSGPAPRAPFRLLPGWTLGTLALAAFFFLVLPRASLGLRTSFWQAPGSTATQAGFSDILDLGQTGAIAPSGDVVLRVIPEEGTREPGYAPALALLRGIALENVDGQRWSTGMGTPPRPLLESFDEAFPAPGRVSLEFFLAPSPHGILPLPYGGIAPVRTPAMPLQRGPGGSLRWRYPGRGSGVLRFLWDPALPLQEGPPGERRWQALTATGAGTASADRFSRRVVPGEVPARELAQRLTAALRRFDYTLDNPSGSAANPLEHFLETSRAGHCEYFSSALALMLRYRGIPARVVNGYRLGPWIPAGGYWLVTQNEAHSWVEYYDPQAAGWRIADPTPPAPPTALRAGTLWAAFQQWTDALRFRWDRHVVRFSDADQLAGLQWLQARVVLPAVRLRASWLVALVLVCLGGAAWRLRRRWPRRRERAGPGGVRALAPLLRAAGADHPPLAGETARQWLLRLAGLRPDRRQGLLAVAEEVDAAAYGGRDDRRLKALAKTEARALQRGR